MDRPKLPGPEDPAPFWETSSQELLEFFHITRQGITETFPDGTLPKDLDSYFNIFEKFLTTWVAMAKETAELSFLKSRNIFAKTYAILLSVILRAAHAQEVKDPADAIQQLIADLRREPDETTEEWLERLDTDFVERKKHLEPPTPLH